MRFSATTLDLSRFPAPLAIRGVDFEAILAERRGRLGALMAQYGIDWDVGGLETDPAIIVEQVDAWREMLMLASINDAVRAVMVAFATGSDLDHLAAFYGMTRRVIEPATDSAPAVMEGDPEMRRRALLAPEAFATAGTHGGYVFHALSADPQVLNADVWSPAPGQVRVAIQQRDGAGAADEDVIGAVRDHLNRDDIRPLTDVISVSSVEVHAYAIDVTVFIQPGPDPVAVKEAVTGSLTAMVASRRIPGRDVPVSAIIAAASVGPVDRVVVNTPVGDVLMDHGALAVCTGVSVTVEEHAG